MKHIQLHHQAGVSTLTLNRPEVRNAFNDELLVELTSAFEGLEQRDEVRCIVLAGQGPAFCAGADLNWMKRMAAYSRDQNLADAGVLAHMLQTLYRCPKPTIARVHGDTYAGGLGLVAACDIAVAAEGVTFCLSETRIGLMAATISPYVIRAMGPRAAHRYFLTAERFGAAEALRIGFVHEVVPPAELDARVDVLARALVDAGPQAVKASKRLVQDVAEQEIGPSLIQRTIAGIADIRVSPEGREGIASFLEKRKPSWLQTN